MNVRLEDVTEGALVDSPGDWPDIAFNLLFPRLRGIKSINPALQQRDIQILIINYALAKCEAVKRGQ
jgi:hypothetical protein